MSNWIRQFTLYLVCGVAFAEMCCVLHSRKHTFVDGALIWYTHFVIIQCADVGPEDEGQNNPDAEPQNGGKPKKQLPKKRKVPIIYYAT